MSISIADYPIGPGHPPFIVAEMSGNHNQSLDRALAIVDAAAKAGAHGLKIQTYTADTMTLDLDEGDFLITDPDSLWKGQSLYRLYEQAHTPWQWHEPIFKRCRELGLIGFSTPFDATAVDFLESLNVPCYKIASFENTDIQLLEKVAATGKPVILSTGMATVAELWEAVTTLRQNGCQDMVLLKCTSAYPADPSSANLRTMPHMKEMFDCQVGLSDHTPGIGVAIAAVAMGAVMVEKHFTLRRADGGVDAAFSLEPDELANLVAETRRAWPCSGQVSYGPVGNETKSMIFRRSLYVVKDMKQGDVFTMENVRSIRPGFGMHTRHLKDILGRRAVSDIKKGTAMTWELVG